MKKIILMTVFSACTLSLHAQWVTSAPNVSITGGKVGIGTSTPATDLDLQGHFNVGGTYSNPEGFNKSISLRGTNHSIFRIFGGSVSAGFWVDNTVTDPKVRLGTFSNDAFGLYTNGTLRVTMSAAGNVGIGTAAPNAKLEVTGATRVSGPNGLSIGPDGNQLRIQSNTDIPNQAFSFINAANAFEGIRIRQASIGANYADVRTAPASGLLVEGNVGIGTYAPQYKLEVVGWGHFSGRLSQAGAVANDNNAAFTNTDPTGYGLYSQGGSGTHYSFHFLNQSGQTVMYGSGDGKIGVGAVPSSDSKLHVQGRLIAQNEGIYARGDKGSVILAAQTGYYDKPTVYSINTIGQVQDLLINPAGGNVGIGTTSPDTKLTVKGIIHTEEVRVDMTVPGPDYVFEPTYNLLPLSEVETYIKANKHLPEVPSAKQMEEEGLNLKEMNLLLLKKVEELTLHLIEQEKENALLKRQVGSQNERIIQIEKILK
jgi:hypothetical protein